MLYQTADAANSDEKGRGFLFSFRADDDSWEWEEKGSHTRVQTVEGGWGRL